MSDQISTCAQFDYGQYAPGVAHELRKAAKRLRAARAAERLQTLGAQRPMDIMKIGNALATVKEKIGPENWAWWLECEAKLSVLDADFFMACAEVFSWPAPLVRRLAQEVMDERQGIRSE